MGIGGGRIAQGWCCRDLLVIRIGMDSHRRLQIARVTSWIEDHGMKKNAASQAGVGPNRKRAIIAIAALDRRDDLGPLAGRDHRVRKVAAPLGEEPDDVVVQEVRLGVGPAVAGPAVLLARWRVVGLVDVVVPLLRTNEMAAFEKATEVRRRQVPNSRDASGCHRR